MKGYFMMYGLDVDMRENYLKFLTFGKQEIYGSFTIKLIMKFQTVYGCKIYDYSITQQAKKLSDVYMRYN